MPADTIGPERGAKVRSIYAERGQTAPIPVVWSSGDIADAAKVNANSVNDWVRRNGGPTPAFISQKGLTFWGEQEAQQIIKGFEDRRKYREERAALPRNRHGKPLLSQIDDETRIKFGYKPRPERKVAKPSRSKAALEARAANPDAPLPRAPKRKFYADGEERPKRLSGGKRAALRRQALEEARKALTPAQRAQQAADEAAAEKARAAAAAARAEDDARAEKALQWLLERQAS